MNRDIVQRYTKRPVMIHAIQYNGANVDLIREFTGGKLSAFNRKKDKIYINTMEGMMLVNVGDYIVRGVVGEYYSVNKTVFELTYEDYIDGNADTTKTSAS